MKIYNLGLDIQPGKYKYKGQYFDKLVEKFQPGKSTPYTVEIVDTVEQQPDAVIYQIDKKLDLVVTDLEKIEARLPRAEHEREKHTLSRCQQVLEREILLCDSGLDAAEQALLKTLPLLSLKPCVAADNGENIEALIAAVLSKANIILFFTVAKKEIRAWSINAGCSVLEAAGKIHSDLQRGFIKAEVVNCRDIDKFFNMAEARSRGFVKVVGRDYIMEADDIIEVRFSV